MYKHPSGNECMQWQFVDKSDKFSLSQKMCACPLKTATEETGKSEFATLHELIPLISSSLSAQHLVSSFQLDKQRARARHGSHSLTHSLSYLYIYGINNKHTCVGRLGVEEGVGVGDKLQLPVELGQNRAGQPHGVLACS